MTLASTIWLTAFGIVAYVFLVDPNVPLYLSLLLKRVKPQASKAKFFVWHNPDLPWVRWRITRHYYNQARILRKEFGLPEND